jgi:hypothetical protein
MSKEVKVRQSILLPSVQYGNVTIEAEVKITGEDSDSSQELLSAALTDVQNSLQEQKDALDKYERHQFKLQV